MLKLVGVSKVYGSSVALSNVSFEVKKGEFVFIVGPSGAGKSTLLKLIHKEIEPTSGEIFFNGESLKKYDKKIYLLRRKIGMIFQDFKLFKRRNVFENVSFPLESMGYPFSYIREKVDKTLKNVGIYEKRNSFPHTLSGGEGQRVSIARALVMSPLVLLADEPTGNLDWKTSFSLMDLFMEINQMGTTIIMCTHNEEIVRRYNKRIIYLREGKKVYEKFPRVN
ncbi:MAG TPA: ATP-binding cassette domain-containing protein [Firmicutes bacterium]|nr:ATP-binding cassette domain-containing protein [Bacillota bacterium]